MPAGRKTRPLVHTSDQVSHKDHPGQTTSQAAATLDHRASGDGASDVIRPEPRDYHLHDVTLNGGDHQAADDDEETDVMSSRDVTVDQRTGSEISYSLICLFSVVASEIVKNTTRFIGLSVSR